VDVSAAIVDDCVIVSFVDVTHRNEIESRLRDSEARHRLWADNSADVIWTMNLEGQMTYMSPAVMTTQGRTPEEAMAIPLEEMFTPDSLAVVQQGFAQALRNVAAGQPVQFHERLEKRRKDGGTTWTDDKATSLYDEEGRFQAILGISRDITEQKRIEDELRATRDRLEATLNALPDFMFRVDRRGRIKDCHLSTQGPFPWPSEALLGRTFAEILPESASRVTMRTLAEAAEQGHHQGGVYALPTPGGVVWHELSIAAMGDSTMEEAEFILLARDITRRKQQEEELRLSEERHRILAENTRDVIWTMQLDGSISYVSPAVEEVRGVTQEEAMRQPIEEILTPASQAVAIAYLHQLHGAVQAGEPPPSYRGEQEYYRKDGKIFWAEVTTIPILREDGSFVELLGVSRDIDERKRHEHELQLARDAANEATRPRAASWRT
jgi:PAS domain S-box-containing protein